jgi:hemerythrin superfamily protein
MPDTGGPATAGPEDDVVDLLLVQHARLEELFVLVTGADAETKRAAFDELVRLLAVHETAEEEVIHPLARHLPGSGGDLVDDRLEEERKAKEILKTLVGSGVEQDGFDAAVLLLREAVLEHARHEERYEFPLLRQHVPAGRLRALAGAVRAAETVAPTRPHPGTESATANAVLGLPVAVLDRVRDAVRRAADGEPGARDGDPGGRGAGSGGRDGDPSAAGDLEEATRDELYEMAKEAGIPGRSNMRKAELAAALREEDDR